MEIPHMPQEETNHSLSKEEELIQDAVALYRRCVDDGEDLPGSPTGVEESALVCCACAMLTMLSRYDSEWDEPALADLWDAIVDSINREGES